MAKAGKRLADFLEARQISQTDFAAELRRADGSAYTKQAISKIISTGVLSPEFLRAFEKAYGRDIAVWLETGKSESGEQLPPERAALLAEISRLSDADVEEIRAIIRTKLNRRSLE